MKLLLYPLCIDGTVLCAGVLQTGVIFPRCCLGVHVCGPTHLFLKSPLGP